MKIIRTSFFILFILSCKTNNEQNSININFEKNIHNFKNIKLSQLTRDVEYIILKSSPEYILGSITGIDIDSENILIADKNNCLLFDLFGNFVVVIGRRGKGPGEFLYHGVPKLGSHNIFVPNSKNLLVYSKAGTFIKNIANPARFDNLQFNMNWMPLTDTTFICHIKNEMGYEENKALIFGQDSDTIRLFENYIKFKRDRNSYSGTDDGIAQFYLHQGKLSFKEYMNDTIFRIENYEKMEPAYILYLGKYRFPTHLRNLSSIEYIEKIFEYIWIRNIYELDNYIFLNLFFANHYPLKSTKEYMINGEIRKGPAPILGIFNKVTKDLFFVDSSSNDDKVNPNGIENDIDGGMNFFPNYRKGDSTLVMIIQAFELKSYIESDIFKNYTPKYLEKKKELEKLANSLKENDNPVLMFVKLKE